MNQSINIGVPIDLQKLLETRLLIQANSGGGKSVLSRMIMEEAVGKVPFIVLDCDGEYYTLKEKFGDIIVIGGQFADLPISMQAVTLLPKEIIGNQLSVVIDLSDLKMPDRIRYVKLFLENMMELPKKYWLPYLVFLEEVHKFCGEQDKQESGPAVRDLMSRGRKMGYCGILITQRISKLHKDAAAEVNNKFVGRTNLDIDMDRAAKELGFSGSSQYTRLSLRDLKPGHFYAFGVAIEPHHVHEVKIKMPQTQIPKAGSIIDIKTKKPTEKILAALSKLNDLPQTVKKEQATIEQLRAEVIRLTRDLKYQTDKLTNHGHVSTEGLAENEKLRNQLEDQRQYVVRLEDEIRFHKSIVEQYSVKHQQMINILSFVRPEYIPKKVMGIPLKSPETKTVQPEKVMGSSSKPSESCAHQPGKIVGIHIKTSFGKCARAILQFLASMPERTFTKAMIGIATGYSPGSGGFNNALSELTSADFIIRGERLQVNNSRMAEITHGVFNGQLNTVEYSIDTFKSKLGKCEREIYEVILEDPEGSFNKEVLAYRTPSKYSHNSGGFNNALSHLTTLELITRNNGAIRLNPELIELM